MTANRCAIGIDLGGTNIFSGIVDSNGHILATAKLATPKVGGPQAVFVAMKGLIRELLPQTGGREILGIGLGIPGTADKNGVVIQSGNLGWEHVPVLPEFADLGLPLVMDNDVRCHTMGELHFGAGRGVSNFILLTLGTGIGSGIVLDGQLYRGPANMAGELGHIPLEPNGPVCGCGKRGCFEALASGTAIARRAKEAMLASSAKELFALAGSGNAQALALVDAIAYDLGRGIACYVNLMNPQRVIVGGGVAMAGDLLFTPMRRYALQETMASIRSTVDIVPAQLGDEAGIVGAASMVPGLVC
ncbi:MAG: ROK family protein [Mycobacterium leprae]